MKSSQELKSIAKENLLGNYRLVVPAILLVSLYSIILNNLASSIYQPGSIFSLLLYILFTILSAILLRFFSLGKSYLFLNLMTKRNIRINDIYHGFRMNSKQTVPLCAIYAIIVEATFVLPLYLFQEYYQLDASAATLLGLTVFLIIGILIAMYFTLTYSQVFYLANDFPQLTTKELFKLSKKLMTGNRGKLLYIQISFIPWMLLAIPTFGLALLWLAPYMSATKTLFYLDLIESQKNKQ
jgi:uncharacterized membrane protein